MLKLKNLVTVNNEKGERIASQVFEKVWFSAAPGDATEVYGADKVKERPKGTSNTSIDELFAAAISYLQEENPKSNPLLVILQLAEEQLGITTGNAIRQSIAPSKPVDEDKAIESMAKQLLKVRKDLKTLDAAKAAVRAMLAQ